MSLTDHEPHDPDPYVHVLEYNQDESNWRLCNRYLEIVPGQPAFPEAEAYSRTTVPYPPANDEMPGKESYLPDPERRQKATQGSGYWKQ